MIEPFLLFTAPKPPPQPDGLSPMLREFNRIKTFLPSETILLFRVPSLDSFMTYGYDAERCDAYLGVRSFYGSTNPTVRRASIKHELIDTFIAKAINAGFGVALGAPDMPNGSWRITRVFKSNDQRERERAATEAERARAERYGCDTDTCLANAAECGGL